MKKEGHPLYQETRVVCACGEIFVTRSTKKEKEIRVEICSNCHPFFTGKQKLLDTEGRVERFRKKLGAQTSESRKQAAAKGKKPPRPPQGRRRPPRRRAERRSTGLLIAGPGGSGLRTDDRTHRIRATY